MYYVDLGHGVRRDYLRIQYDQSQYITPNFGSHYHALDHGARIRSRYRLHGFLDAQLPRTEGNSGMAVPYKASMIGNILPILSSSDRVY
ncbi:hypothetical protein GOP47_0004227 [Adiantum capillus-veneris]|uniref:Uncharacterized protein n=1 Tax=Adiantum capillus-veneris TaxID=13818 RepID=A0A9D4V766_ADICA|nr:hypothetical protein GOP47_0004227 [Adiantum capillus-veneris]